VIVSLLDNYIADTYVWCNVEHVAQRRRDRTTVVRFCVAAASAAITDQHNPRQPVRYQASSRHPGAGHVVPTHVVRR